MKQTGTKVALEDLERRLVHGFKVRHPVRGILTPALPGRGLDHFVRGVLAGLSRLAGTLAPPVPGCFSILVKAASSFALPGLLLGILLAGPAARADEAAPSEYQVKAAFLYNFAKFVKWPDAAFAETNSPIVIGILGEDPFGADLALAIKGKTIGGRPLKMQRVGTAAEIKLCQVVFVCQKPKRDLAETLAPLKKAGILTVSETDGFIKCGGMINFVMEGTRVRFEINDPAATQAGLSISSKLLSLARRKEKGG